MSEPLTTTPKYRAVLFDLDGTLLDTAPDFLTCTNQLLHSKGTLYFDNLADRTQPFPGIPELLSKLEQHNIPWGIVTNKPERYTLAILDQLPLWPPPATVICPDHVQRTKPDPESVLLALQQINIEPHEAVFIGDHLRDIEAGLRAGTATIAAAYGYLSEDEDPDDWGAHHTVASATQLANLIF